MEIQSLRRLHMASRMQKLTNCEIPVASAAPAVPISMPKIKTGSRIMFKIPPVVMPTMANRAFPWKRRILFMIKDVIMNGAASKM